MLQLNRDAFADMFLPSSRTYPIVSVGKQNGEFVVTMIHKTCVKMCIILCFFYMGCPA